MTVLLSLILVFITLPYLFPYFNIQVPQDATAFSKEIALLQLRQADTTHSFTRKNYEPGKFRTFNNTGQRERYGDETDIKPFYFDPNTASSLDWKNLGLREKTITTIEKYLLKGGRFYKPEDIGKIWGLRPQDVKRLIPFVQIQPKNRDRLNEKKTWQTSLKQNSFSGTVDINTADATAFEALPGIGPKLSLRILNFREKLGGFYHTEQLAETFGLPDSTFQLIKPMLRLNEGGIKKININTATVEEMKVHPYLRFALSNAIVQYRMQHGNFAQVEDLKKIMIISNDAFNKIAPYVKVN